LDLSVPSVYEYNDGGLNSDVTGPVNRSSASEPSGYYDGGLKCDATGQVTRKTKSTSQNPLELVTFYHNANRRRENFSTVSKDLNKIPPRRLLKLVNTNDKREAIISKNLAIMEKKTMVSESSSSSLSKDENLTTSNLRNENERKTSLEPDSDTDQTTNKKQKIIQVDSKETSEPLSFVEDLSDSDEDDKKENLLNLGLNLKKLD